MERLRGVVLVMLMMGGIWGQVFAQETQRYLLGEEAHLQIVVYVLGEVSRPGEYLVSDNTNVVELISKAGGTTDFSNLGDVTIRREVVSYDENSPRKVISNDVIRFNVQEYLKNKNSPEPPLLKPGDVIYVRKNVWSKWRAVATVMRDISVVATAIFLYFRTFDNK